MKGGPDLIWWGNLSYHLLKERWRDGSTRLRLPPSVPRLKPLAMQESGSCAGQDFHMTENQYFQFRTEFFNAFNRANFNPPDVRRDSSGFGQILSAGNARIVQFALKLYF